jgi:hypothetical protein
MTRSIVHVIGGGTRFHIDSHLYLGSKGSGDTARKIAEICRRRNDYEVELHLTNMAEPRLPIRDAERTPLDRETTYQNPLDTNKDVRELVERLIANPRTKMIIFNAAMVDFDATLGGVQVPGRATRLPSRTTTGEGAQYTLSLSPSEKVVGMIRKTRKDIFLVAFKQTSGATEEMQYQRGLNLLKAASVNLVLANDSVTKQNMIIVPEEAAYHVTKDRHEALLCLVDMAYARSKLTFTRSTIVPGSPVPFDSELVPHSLRTVVDHCIRRGAYKPFRGATAGHFAIKIGEGQFLTSRRKTNFNDMENVGLVRVESSGPDSVVAYGSRPSVGGQSQRIVFAEHPDTDCIVHFHAEPKKDSRVPTVSQREFECGSHECGANTSRGLKKFGDLYAVNLENHGPNIVFRRDADPQEVINFIEENFDLATKSGGYQLA